MKWLAPAAESIEAAADSLKSVDPKLIQAEIQELASFGSTRIQTVFDTLWPIAGDEISNAFTGMSHDSDVTFAYGYLLGLQAAREILAASPLLALKSIDPQDLL